MTLKLRDGWESVTRNEVTYLYPPDGIGKSFSWYVSISNDKIIVYPHGGLKGAFFSTIEDAHAYLIKEGSESPWEKSC